MQSLTHFSLPLKGMKNGIHEFDFSVKDEFFQRVENSAVKHGSFDFHLVVKKKSDHIEIDFELEGTYKTECDRCSAEIDLPIQGEHKLIVKYTHDEETTDEEVWRIGYESPSLELNKAIYEFIVLSMPMIKTFDCEDEIPQPCNQKAKEFLDNQEEVEETDENSNNPFAEVLKNIQLN